MKRKYSHEISSSDETITKFLKEYNIKINNNSNIYDKFKKSIPYIIKNKKYKKCIIQNDDYNIKVGDNIEIEYYPNSQKYIDYCNEQKKYGKVLFIDNDNFDIILYNNVSTKFYIKSLDIPNLSYFGDSRCWHCNIKKI